MIPVIISFGCKSALLILSKKFYGAYITARVCHQSYLLVGYLTFIQVCKMAYLGKEFKLDKEENVDALIAYIDSADPNSKAKSILHFKPNQKIVKNGDEYTITLNAGDFKKEINFRPGVPFDDELGDDVKVKSTVNVEGDTFTQVMDFGAKGAITLKREYQADSLKIVSNFK
ncbi:unnamed protein product [Diatraea saccharalis]|uniref:Uncharacterized protein n=1 Tax=Diatraea saccharalis TaxID=40085 RepID=A0A9P0G3F3_9NEOP|nr:unnamed protein product [Diatraea saccharalis]